MTTNQLEWLFFSTSKCEVWEKKRHDLFASPFLPSSAPLFPPPLSSYSSPLFSLLSLLPYFSNGLEAGWTQDYIELGGSLRGTQRIAG